MPYTDKVQRWITWALVAAGCSLVWLFQGFIKPAAIASLLVLMTNSWGNYLERRFLQWRAWSRAAVVWRATCLTLGLGLLVLVPLLSITSYVLTQVSATDLLKWQAEGAAWLARLGQIQSPPELHKLIVLARPFMDNLSGSDGLRHFFRFGLTSLQQLSTSTFDLIMVLVLFFLIHLYHRPLRRFLADLSPLPFELQEQIVTEVSSTLQVVFGSLFALAIAQGAAFAGLMIFYDYNPLILGLAAGICSLVPIFGTALVWVPVAINEVSHGQLWGAAIIVIYGWAIHAVIIDNFLRLYFLNKIAKSLAIQQPINEFLLFFAIASGLAMFGFWGVMLGPTLVTLFLALARTYISLTALAKSN